MVTFGPLATCKAAREQNMLIRMYFVIFRRLTGVSGS
jgi:hypothetical protein